MKPRRREAASSVITVIVAAFLSLAAGAGAGTPTSQQSSLSVTPTSLSWPDVTAFERRLAISGGPEGFTGVIGFTDAGWGGGTSGSPFETDAATLQGPGELTPLPMPAIAPDPGACFRGGPPFYSSFPRYRLTLGPDQTTAVVAASALLAPPLPGMPRSVGATILPDGADSATELSAPLTIGGKTGVRIESRFAGDGGPRRLELTVGRSFKLVGSTEPALARRKIRLDAERRVGPGPDSGRQKLVTVRTDSSGRFRTPALWLDQGTWVLKTSLINPGKTDNTPNCAGTVTVNPSEGSRNVTVAALDGHTFRSIRVGGRSGIGQKRIRFRFFRHADSPDQPEQPFLGVSAGCNTMGARYRLANRKLRWIGPIMQTEMACLPKRRMQDDRWLARRLKRGMKARLNGRHLTLTRGKTRIVLRQVR